MIRRWSLLVPFLLATGACFNPRYPEGIPCSEARTCPPGQTCDPAALVCRPGPLEPAPPDAAPTRPLDAAPALPPDATSEITIDAAPPADASRGACANNPCGDNSTCTETPEPPGYTCACEAGHVAEDDACRLPRTCLELLTDQPGSGDGLYAIDPDLDAPGQPFETFCDMSTDGGGWTLVQRTVWDFAETSLLHTDYATFQGVLLGSPAPGQPFRVPAARWPALQETREHLMRKVPRRASDGGDCGALYYKATAGVWTVPAGGGATLTGANDPSALFNAQSAFSTLDDGPSGDLCVNRNLAVPWLYTSCCSTCPTFGGSYWNDGPHPMSSRMGTPDLGGETMYTRCAPGQPRQSDNGGYFGINTMEYYLR
jgi:hypothetical protein